jgi:tetratricopeptide (TPR) repeat protein
MSKENYLPPGERDEVVKELEANDRDAETSRQNNDQQQLLAHLERGLYLRRRLHPEASPEVAAACHQLCEVCNVAGTSLLSQGHLKGAHELLKRAEQVADRNQRDKAITWNNLACYYRRTGKLRSAVTLLERALEVEEYAEPSAAAQTHLNLCATLSQLQRHADALYHAQSAMIRMYEILSPLMVAGKLSTLPLKDEQFELTTVLCIAYHNTAVEHEYLKNYDGAVCAYSEGARWAEKFLGEGHQLIGILKESVEAVKGKLKPGSGALRRAEEVLNGRGQKQSNTQETIGDQHAGLITPRDPPVAVDGEDTGDVGVN